MFGAAGQKATGLPLESGTMFETKAITRAAAGICYAGGSPLYQNGPGGRKAQPSGLFVVLSAFWQREGQPAAAEEKTLTQFLPFKKNPFTVFIHVDYKHYLCFSQ